MSGARSQAFPPISALLPVTTSKLLLLYSHWIYKRRGREDEGKDGGKKVKDGKSDGDGWKKETFGFFHLEDYDKWPGL